MDGLQKVAIYLTILSRALSLDFNFKDLNSQENIHNDDFDRIIDEMMMPGHMSDIEKELFFERHLKDIDDKKDHASFKKPLIEKKESFKPNKVGRDDMPTNIVPPLPMTPQQYNEPNFRRADSKPDTKANSNKFNLNKGELNTPQPIPYPNMLPPVMLQPQPIIVPMRTFYEPVIHDHPSPKKIRKLIKKDKRKWKRKKYYSYETDSSSYERDRRGKKYLDSYYDTSYDDTSSS